MTVKHFIELGIGNGRWLSTELEFPDGSEVRVPGARWPQQVRAAYLRVWIGYAVIVLRWGGLDFAPKRRWAFKLLLGLEGASGEEYVDIPEEALDG